MSSKVTLRLIGCGGAGINLVSKFEDIKNKDTYNFAQMELCYVDTSSSNIRSKNIPEESLFLFEGMDGSGKIRSANASEVSKNSLAILQRFTPGAVNIVVHSGSGGSGSVVGPSLVSELKKKGEQVIVIIIGSTDTIIETKNTYKTLETYESISKLRSSSVVTHYLENQNKGRGATDSLVVYSITMLAGLYCGNHAELDSADLKSWLNFATTTTPTPTIASLTFHTSKEEMAELDKVVSVATLATNNMVTRIDPPPPYQAVGFVPDAWSVGSVNSLNLIDKDPLHFAISFDLLKNAYASLKAKVQENEENIASLVNTNTVFNSDAKSTDNGLVL
jgi:hypothetical protein